MESRIAIGCFALWLLLASGCGSELNGAAREDAGHATDTHSPDVLEVSGPETSDALNDMSPDATEVEPRDDVRDETVPDALDAADLADGAETDANDANDANDAVDASDAIDADEAADLSDAHTTLDIADTTAFDGADTAIADAGPGTPVHTVSWTIRTADDGSLDDAPGIAYCLSANDCALPDNALNWNDRDPRSVDVWHLAAGALTREAIDRIEIRFPVSDTWGVACVQVAVDGETIHCAMNDHVVLGDAPGASPVWNTSPTISCDTCWDGMLTHGPVVGATSDHDTHLWVRTDSGRPVALRLGTSEPTMRALAPVALATPRPDDDFTHTFHVEGLAPDTTYYYDLDVAGRRYPPLAAPAFAFRTAPAAGTPAHFTVGIGSCARADIDKVPTQPAFAPLVALAPDFFLFAGDNVYFDPLQNGQITSLGGARAFYREALQRTFSWASPLRNARADFGRDARATLLTRSPTWATWDDHDFLHDNSFGVAFGVPDPDRLWARQAFVEYWPNGSFGDHGDGIYSRFSWGDVDVFMVDTRYFRDIAHTSLLGDAQRAWLYTGLATSRATFKLVVDGSDWSAESISDSWAGWPGERRDFFDLIVAARVEGVVLISGDSHRSELRVIPGADGGYPIPQIVSSGIATTIRGCPVSNEFFEVDGTASCYGADTGATTSFVTLDVDTTRADPQISAVIHDVDGRAQRTFTFKRSALTFRPRTPLSRRDADFDGDGHADLAIGVPDEDTNAPDDGLVHVFFGSNAGLHSQANASLTQAALSGANEADDHFGAALAHGDLDGDGFDDLVIGVPGEDFFDHPGTGRAVVLRGSPAGLVSGGETLDIEPDAAPFIDQRFAAALATGDFDGDGMDDLAVGVPGDGGGAVRIFRGGAGPLVRGARLAQGALGDGGLDDDEAGDAFGQSLASGDFDGDGFMDLAIGVPRESTSAGSDIGGVVIVHGDALGLSLERRSERSPASVGLSATPGLQFGAALIAGDLDGDGVDDLAVGAPGASGGAGRVARYLGARGTGLAATGTSWSIASLVPGFDGQAGDALGLALALGDFDGDGVLDLAIGAPGRADARGLAVVRFASGRGVWLGQDVTNWTVADPGDRFGAALAAHDFDGDGHADLAVGAPGDIVAGVGAAGVVDVFWGRPNGFDLPLAIHGLRMTQRWHQGLNGLTGGGGPEQGDQLGTSLGR